MGAGGYGLLDNDSAHDYFSDFTRGIRQDIIRIGDNDSRKIAGNLSAAVGILLRLSFDFDPGPVLDDKPHFYPRLICAISHNFDHFLNFPGNAPQILGALLRGRGEELSRRPAKLDRKICECLYDVGLLQGSVSELEMDLFAHPSSRTYMALKSKELISEIEYSLKNRNNVIDMSYSFLGGMIALTLVLPLRGLKASRIEKWRKHCTKIWNSQGADEEANDLEFEIGFRENVQTAFECASLIYSGG